MVFATKESVKNLIYISLQCAVFYAEYEKQTFDVNGQKLTGLRLERFVNQCNSKRKIPSEISKWLFTSWINPKFNLYLKEGGFRYAKKLPTAIYWFQHDRVTPEECSYLIQRFSKMYNEITERYATQDNTENHFLN